MASRTTKQHVPEHAQQPFGLRAVLFAQLLQPFPALLADRGHALAEHGRHLIPCRCAAVVDQARREPPADIDPKRLAPVALSAPALRRITRTGRRLAVPGLACSAASSSRPTLVLAACTATAVYNHAPGEAEGFLVGLELIPPGLVAAQSWGRQLA
jgi:hypothetical protein